MLNDLAQEFDLLISNFIHRPNDRYIGYLPLAHIMELACGKFCIPLEFMIIYDQLKYDQRRGHFVKHGEKMQDLLSFPIIENVDEGNFIWLLELA